MDIGIYLIAGGALLIALTLMFFLGKNRKDQKQFLIVSLFSLAFIVAGITYAYLFLIEVDDQKVELSTIILTNIVVIIIYLAGLFLVNRANQQESHRQKLTTQRLAIQGILVGMASVLMLISFPVMPAAPFLKVELSALIIFMTLIWFDFKTAVVVSLITNIVHYFMPSSAPIIPLLDEMINFLATMLFILPTAIFIKRESLDVENKSIKILILSLAGFVSTVVLMVLFNQYINLPYIYNIPMSFTDVLLIFGVFNIIKWGLNLVVINLTWKRFYVIRQRFFAH
jgi:riboflavin transporter FmnP/heme/copper-type cytochrome/quinol oxidase subunit 4